MIDVLNVSAEVVAAIFGIAITVVAIIVQLAATRFNHQITDMFIRDPVNISVQSFFLLTTMSCIWLSVSPEFANKFSMLGVWLVTVALLLLLPYFYYVFTFISPLNVINRIGKRAERAIAGHQRVKTINAVEHLQDVARNAIDQGDRAIALACVNTFSELFEHYQTHRPDMPSVWFEVEGLEQDPDFVSFEPTAMAALTKSQLWFESKILQQFLNMMWMSVPTMRDVAASLGIAVKRAATTHLDREDVTAVALRAMNSLIRASLNARDARTSYHLLSQYRTIIEVLLNHGFEQTAMTASAHLAGYGRLAFSTNQPFILEVAAFDLASLIKHAHKHSPATLEGMMSEFLELDQQIRFEADEESLLGVRRAQMQVASYFLEQGEDKLVGAIVDDLKLERSDRLQRIANHLQKEDQEMFWEFTPRGINFNYLEPEMRPYLDKLMELIRNAE